MNLVSASGYGAQLRLTAFDLTDVVAINHDLISAEQTCSTAF
jgi:hypothetical protein